jgi:hypothetical protein
MIKMRLGSILVLAMAAGPIVAPPALAQEVSQRAIDACTDLGGKIRGTMCELRDGRVCQATPLGRSGECFDAEGRLLNADGSTSSSSY